ncbi:MULTISPECIES: permease prefix domain 1-containing protein [Paenibacillus]|uniref:permease prefix domain 1-containing protein n=1 Tax=Paenibacillus TaxID=44249 RepID=UPI0022B8FFAF|nr:permease prefix domain 1-containing protein [Paenibacillus caseinilyticus]MCZ8523914.1 permease prefix domain 1-containing protein [Paenibacillus caseinilyticus]
MDKADRYLNRILRGTFLTAGEKAEWKAEMRTHIDCTVEELAAEGATGDEALERTLRQFGDPRMLRRDLTRQTYGASVDVILQVSLLLLASFVACYLQNQFRLYDDTLVLPLIPLTLLAPVLFLLATRSRIDRIGLLAALLPYGFLHVCLAIGLPEAVQWFGSMMSSYAPDWRSYQVFLALMFLWGLLLLKMTKNIGVSALPLFLALLYVTFGMFKSLNVYGFSVMDGVHPPAWGELLNWLEGVLIRLFVLACFLAFAHLYVQLQNHKPVRTRGD